VASSPGVAACFACPGRHVPASGWWWWGFEPVDEAAGFGVEVAHRDEPPVGVFRRPWRRLGGGMRARQLGDLAMSIRGLAAHTSRTASAVIFGSSRSDLGRSAASRSSRPQVTGGAGAGWASTGVSLAGDSRSVTIALPGARGVGTVNRRAGGRRCRRQIAAPAPWSAPRRTPAGGRPARRRLVRRLWITTAILSPEVGSVEVMVMSRRSMSAMPRASTAHIAYTVGPPSISPRGCGCWSPPPPARVGRGRRRSSRHDLRSGRWWSLDAPDGVAVTVDGGSVSTTGRCGSGPGSGPRRTRFTGVGGFRSAARASGGAGFPR